MWQQDYRTSSEDLYGFEDDYSRYFDDMDKLPISRTLFAQGITYVLSSITDRLSYVGNTIIQAILTGSQYLGNQLDWLLGLIPWISAGLFKVVTYPLVVIPGVSGLNTFFDRCGSGFGSLGWFSRCTIKESFDTLLQLILLLVVLIIMSLVLLSICSKPINIAHAIISQMKQLLWHGFRKTVLGPIISLLDWYIMKDEIKKRDKWENYKAGRPLDDDTPKRARIRAEMKRKEEGKRKIDRMRLRGNGNRIGREHETW